MKTELLEKDIKEKERYIQNLEGSLLYFQQDKKAHEEDINLVSYELYFLKDQLTNYHTVLNLLQEESDVRISEADL